MVVTRGTTELPCRLVDPDLFFAEAPADVEEAKALCLACPVREACLAGALSRREPWGVWGGELFIAGVIVPRKRPRGRPRKYPVVEPFAPAAKDEAAA
jgi:WhiB family transcriptional regulator, redox-sensing transcriptional regulator